MSPLHPSEMTSVSTATPERLLAAGALVPPEGDKRSTAAGTDLDDATAATADLVSARSYLHPALGDRPVVRLVADNVAPGDDLTLEFYGFGAPAVTPGVGRRRRRSVGFPAWPLIHDPDHAHFALEVVKQLKREARRARAKPGHAWDGISKLADAMDRSVVHFLPSFWEEVGRTFIELGNGTYAARAFGQAREAERVHALAVDEDHLREVFLEFALAGALTVKVLSTYSKDLQASREPADAWALFRDLCVRRTQGGLPPWKGMPRDLRRLIKAAGLDVAAEETAFLREVLGSQAMKRAPGNLWQTYGKLLAKLATDDDEVAGLLLNLLPVPTDMWNDGFYLPWLEHLEAWDLLANLWRDDVAPEAGPRGGVAAWIERFLTSGTAASERILDLLRRSAERLISDGRPLQLAISYFAGASIDVDLLDLALELGVPVADPPGRSSFDLTRWATGKGPERRRDPVHLAADPRFSPLLAEAVPGAAGDKSFDRVAPGKTALTELRRQWLHAQAIVDGGGLPHLANQLDLLTGRTSRASFEEFPQAFPGLEDADLAAVLARTLRGGLFDELGWDALDEAAAELAPGGDKEKLKWSGNPPYLVVSDGVRALALGPGGRLLDHELRLPGGAELEGLSYLDGELVVRFRDPSSGDPRYYWSGDPDKVRPDDWSYGTMRVSGAVVEVPGGGCFRGDGVVHAGGEFPESPETFCHDGEHFWTLDWDQGKRYWRELDPASGRKGRRSLPSFFENGVAEGWEVPAEDCHLLGLGPGLEASPLGSRDGLVGWRVRQRADGEAIEAEGIDGRRFSSLLGTGGSLPAGLLDLPGSRCPLSASVGGSHAYARMWQADGSHALAELSDLGPFNAGQPVALPVLYWHLFQPRDPAGSQALRAASPAAAARLLECAMTELSSSPATGGTANDGDRELPETGRLAAELFPDVTHPGLRRGLLGVVGHAAELAGRHRRLVAERDPQAQDAAASIEVWDHDEEGWLREVAGTLGMSGWASESYTRHWSVAGPFLCGDVSAADSRPVPELAAPWPYFLDRLEARVYSALWLHQDLGGLLRFLKWWSHSPLARLEPPLRLITGKFDDQPPFPVSEGYGEWFAGEHRGSRYLGAKRYRDCTILEAGCGGELHPLPGFRVETEVELQAPWKRDRMDRLVALLEDQGPPYPSEALLAAIGDRLDLSHAEAALVWTGFANFRDYERSFLPKSLRERLGLKVVEADNARKSLKFMEESARRALTAALVDGDPDELWTDPVAAPVERLAAAYRRLAPPRLRLPDRLVRELEEVVGYDLDKSTAMAALASPDDHPLFATDGRWELRLVDGYPKLVRIDAPKDAATGSAFSAAALALAVECLPLFAYRLPAGDPAHRAMTAVARQVGERLKSPDLVLFLAGDWLDESRLEKLLGAAEPAADGGLLGDQGLVAGAEGRNKIRLGFRPARIRDDGDRQRLRDMAAALNSSTHGIRRLELWQSPGLRTLADRLATTPVAAGQWEANPLQSAPELVEKVRAAHTLGEDAAVLYLQILALPDPTTANVKQWNGWTPARIKKALAELVAAGLVLEAKRARAGRKHFLPGGWEALKSPHLPLETWKLPLYGLTRNSEGKVETPLALIVPLRPVHEVFEQAWERVEDGDAPRYEEVS